MIPNKHGSINYTKRKEPAIFKPNNRHKNLRILKDNETHIDKYFLKNLNIPKLKEKIKQNSEIRKKVINFLKKDPFGIEEVKKLDPKIRKKLEKILGIKF
jgi:hypothetical protein